MNSSKKQIFYNTFFSIVFIFSIINVLGFTFENFKPTKDKFLINILNKLENQKKDSCETFSVCINNIKEMDLIYDNLSNNQILLNFGFVATNDFNTYLRMRNNLYTEDKKIVFENLHPQQKLINSWDKSQKVSILFSCRYTNCMRDKVELVGPVQLFVNYKENSIIKSKKTDYLCKPRETIQIKLKNFGLYDCFEKVSFNKE